MNEHYLRLNPDGTLQHVIIKITERNLNKDLLEVFGKKVARVTSNIVQVEGQPFSIVATGTELYGFVVLKGLTLRTGFRMGLDKILRPVYPYKGDPYANKEEGIDFAPVWTPPASMKLVFAAKILEFNMPSPTTSWNHCCYLMAFSGINCWRLPLPNVYDNCDVCMGQFDGRGDSVLSAFMKAYDQFNNSTWNSDLLDTWRQTNSDALFHFKPTVDSFEQCDTPNDWTRLCFKSPTTVSQIIGGAL